MTTGEASARAGAETIRDRLGRRSIVLIGMPGAGKTTVGRRLAQVIGLPFVDADHEIERAAGMTIPEIFAAHGESGFRDGEKRVIARILTEGPQVLATGGGAFMAPETRAAIGENGLSVWLKAEVPTLLARVRRRNNRPLLANADPEGTLRALLAVREPVFAEADLTVRSRDMPHDVVVQAIIDALKGHFDAPAH
ncbi:shikimate kinase [Pseudoxanthobacter sp.]|uniref:shikimate kinase n=1 Tax=Pseudoxanthobacter sp. TaxID=1925742 RepID=UPI002FE0106F